MTKILDKEPWRALPGGVAELIEPELEATTEEILATIAREVPEYRRPLEGSFGRGIQVGVSEALRQFVALVRDPDAGRDPGRDVYVGLGRGELRQGRTLDSLQSAYRVGARVAWRRLSTVAREAELDPDALAAARAAGWRLPHSAAALACAEATRGRIAGRLPADALTASLAGTGCVLIGDPARPGRAAEIERAAAGRAAALGPAGPRSQLARSWDLARAALRAAEAGAVVG